MSGAEIFLLAGLFSSVSQLVAYGENRRSWVLDIFRRSQVGPQELRKLYEEACNVHTLAKKVDPGNFSEHEIDWFVRGCTAESEALIDLLGSLRIRPQNPSHTGSKFDRVHTAIEWKAKEQKIKEHLEAISRYQNSLICYRSLLRPLSPNLLFTPASSGSATSTSLSRAPTMTEPARINTLQVLKAKFIGQEEYLQILKTKFGPDGSICRGALVGLPGAGKSRLALEYAQRLYADGHSAFWLSANEEEVFEQSFLQIGHAMSTSEICSVADTRKDYPSPVPTATSHPDTTLVVKIPSCNDIKRYLESPGSGRWIMVVDNLDQETSLFGPRSLAQLLPQSNPSSEHIILFTSRDRRLLRDLVPFDGVVQVEGLQPGDAKRLLSERSNDHLASPKDIATLATVLAYSPLAIIQAASYIAEQNLRIADYLELYEHGDVTLAELLGHHQTRAAGQLPAMKVWWLSFDRLKEQDALALHILRFMACLSNIRIPVILLPKENSSTSFLRAVRALEALFFIEQSENEQSYYMHPLIRLAIRSQLQATDQFEQHLQLALMQILHIFPEHFENLEQFRCGSSLLPHAQQLLHEDACRDLAANNPSYAIVALRVTNFLLEQGSYETAARYAKLAAELSVQTFGKQDTRTFMAKSNLAVCLRRAGKLREAESVTQDVLNERESILGADHPDTLASMNNLANILCNRGRYEDAENVYRRAIKGKEKALGRNHEDTQKSLENLAIALERQGKLEEAEDISRRVIDWRQQHLGPHNPWTLSAFSNLGTVLQAQERWEDAWEMHTTALVGRSNILGQLHPETINSRANLAAILQCQRQYEAAELIAQQVLELRTELLGEDHPETLKAMRTMANILHCQKKYSEAEQMSRQAFVLARSVLGENHPHTSAAKKHALELRAWLKDHPEATSSGSADVD
jgi:tetratricopeptide (TPR) repeat protein